MKLRQQALDNALEELMDWILAGTSPTSLPLLPTTYTANLVIFYTSVSLVVGMLTSSRDALSIACGWQCDKLLSCVAALNVCRRVLSL
jgi:hypothetical protein